MPRTSAMLDPRALAVETIWLSRPDERRSASATSSPNRGRKGANGIAGRTVAARRVWR